MVFSAGVLCGGMTDRSTTRCPRRLGASRVRSVTEWTVAGAGTPRFVATIKVMDARPATLAGMWTKYIGSKDSMNEPFVKQEPHADEVRALCQKVWGPAWNESTTLVCETRVAAAWGALASIRGTERMEQAAAVLRDATRGVRGPRRFAGWVLGRLLLDDAMPVDGVPPPPPDGVPILLRGETWAGALVAVTDPKIARLLGCAHLVSGTAFQATDLAEFFPVETIAAHDAWTRYRSTFATDPGEPERLFVVGTLDHQP